MAEPRAFLDANVLFTAAYSPDGLSALIIEAGAARRVVVLTSLLAILEARRNLEAKRPVALPAFERHLRVIEVVADPSPSDVDRLTPAELAADDRPILAAAIAAGATRLVTGDQRDFGGWMSHSHGLGVQIMTPRQFLGEIPRG